MKEILKDIILSILIVVCIGIILSIVFYDKISIGKVIPESEDYVLSEQMQKELEDSNMSDAEEVIVNYYIKASDLNKYERTNEYVKGKSNPFAEVDLSDTENNTDGDAAGDNSVSGENNNSGSGNFYEDDGTK